MSQIKTFEDLNCWKKANEIRKEISLILKTLPNDEKYGLIPQMRRSSRSVTHNIAEGYGRFHFKENVQFCRIARGSLYELLDQLITTKDELYISEQKYDEIRLLIMDGIKLLNGFINYLKKQ